MRETVAVSFISRGFHGRRDDDADPKRVPPGQYLTDDFPVLSAGPTPHTPLEEWTFSIVERGTSGRRGRGRSSARCRARRSPSTSTASRAGRSSTRPGRASRSTRCSRRSSTTRRTSLAFCDGGYTTNLPIEDVTGRQGVGRVRLRRRAARARARRPGAAARAAPLLLEEREVGARARAARRGRARLLGDDTATTSTATRGASSGTRETELAGRHGAGVVDETPRVRTLELDVPDWHGPPRRPASRRAADGRGRLPAPSARTRSPRRRASRSRSPSSGSTTARSRRT